MKSYRHVQGAWDDAAAAKLDPVGRLIYRSNLLGSDQRITNTGGGNTSAKLTETDPLTGRPVEVLWIKGSGGDLRTSTRANFSSLYQQKLLDLQPLYAARADKGLKTPREDEMVGKYAQTVFNLNPRPPSIDTPLHSFLPARHIDHLHPNAIIALAAAGRSEELTREIFGVEMAYVPWMRPGFELGLAMQEIVRKQPQARAIMMGQHGFITWADDDKACYYRSLDLIEKAAAAIEARYAAKGGDRAAFGGEKFGSLAPERRRALWAEILPWLRGQLARSGAVGTDLRAVRGRLGEASLPSMSLPSIATVQDDDATLRFVGAQDAERLAELGTSCPDHFLRTKIKPLYVAWDPARGDAAGLKRSLAAGLESYARDYASYYEAHKRKDSPPMRDPNPTVILIPGLGLVGWGKDKSESRVTAEFYRCAIEVMRGAEALDRYVALPRQEAFDIEYWTLEEAKLRRQPPEKELARRVVIVVGAGSGIGRQTARRLARDGAHLVCADLNEDAARAAAEEIVAQNGAGIGVAGSGLSACGPAVGLAADITSRASLRRLLDDAALAFGGFDSICVTAGVFFPSDTTGHIPDEKWAPTYALNVTGSYLVADEAARTWREQGLPGTLVLTTSANATVAKKGSLAYDTSKAAVSHLVRELAIELAPLVRVNGVAPATVVEGSAMFPRERVIGSLAKYGIASTADEATESLVRKLAQFYAERTLTKTPITPADQAEAYFLLVGERLSKTTGQILAVDGGLPEAFLR